MKEKQVTLEAQIHFEDGMYWAEVVDHPGLFASGETLDELKEALIEAWFLYTDDAIASTNIKHIPRKAEKRPPRKPPLRAEELCGEVDQLRLLVPA